VHKATIIVEKWPKGIFQGKS